MERDGYADNGEQMERNPGSSIIPAGMVETDDEGEQVQAKRKIP